MIFTNVASFFCFSSALIPLWNVLSNVFSLCNSIDERKIECVLVKVIIFTKFFFFFLSQFFITTARPQ